jgi:SPP1 family predicted phage head-tail adaptor
VPLNPGRMRLLIRLEQRTTVKNAAGEPRPEWLLFRQCRAEPVRSAGRELFTSEERLARVPTQLKIRFVDGVVPKMRIVSDGKVFNILSAVDPDGLRAELLITAEERVGEVP